MLPKRKFSNPSDLQKGLKKKKHLSNILGEYKLHHVYTNSTNFPV